MLTQVRKKIVQKDIKKYSELRIVDWWSPNIVSYIRKYSYLGNQRYSMENARASFKHSHIQTDLLIPYYQVEETTYNLIPCPSGIFIKGHKDDEFNDLEEVKIEKSFLLGETEITQELYCAVMNVKNPSKFKDDAKNPVERVSWYDALIFCNKLSDFFGLDRYYTIIKDGQIIDTIEKNQKNYVIEMNEESKGFRLPTEWEWEYAAKAGTQLLYSGSDDIGEVGWYFDNTDDSTKEIKRKNPNAWGFYDMTGNVGEWCENKYSSNSDERVIRGCSWDSSSPETLYLTHCSDAPPTSRQTNVGFRVCRYI